jgi:predicted outer membrane repeat protein
MSAHRVARPAFTGGALWLVLPAFLLGGPAGAAGLFVPTEIANLQLAIDSAAPGDTVFVEAGTYTGPGNKDLTFRGKNVVVFGIEGAEATIIDCEGSDVSNARGFIFTNQEPSTAVVEGLTIRNGYLSGTQSPDSYGGGMLISGPDTNPRIKNCRFENNVSHTGGGAAAVDHAVPAFIGCVFSANHAVVGGGASASSDAYFVECEFIDNDVLPGGVGGGLECFSTSSPVVRDCVFRGNAAWGGGGLGCSTATPVVAQCFFSGNSSTRSGGSAVYSATDANVTLSRCVFIDNVAQSVYGGAVACNLGEASISWCTIVGNAGPVGAGIYVRNAGLIQVENTIIAFNEESAGFACDGGTVILTCTDIYGNEGGDWVGCIADQAGINGNMAADPLFCNAGHGNLYLAEASPCASEHAGACGQIGRYGVDCVTAVAPTSWGAIKAHYRR